MLPSCVTVSDKSKAVVNEYWWILSFFASPKNILWPSGLNSILLIAAQFPIYIVVSSEVEAVDRSYAVDKDHWIIDLASLSIKKNFLPSLLISKALIEFEVPISKLVLDVGATLLIVEVSKGVERS